MATVTYGTGYSGYEALVNDQITPNDQVNPQIAGLTGGRYFIVWDQPGLHSVSGRMFNPDGSALGSEFFVNSTTGSFQYDPSVAGLSNGNAVVTFTDTNEDIRVRLFGPNGVALGP